MEANLSTWLTAWRNRGRGASESPIIELLVVAGADAGNQFTLEGQEVLIGRGRTKSGDVSVIHLADGSISRQQAWIRRGASGASITHIPTASNPTIVNGAVIDSQALSVGDRIEMGHVVIDVRAREGTNLSGLTEIMTGATHDIESDAVARADNEPTILLGSASPGLADEQTEIRPMQVSVGELTILSGGDPSSADRAQAFPIGLEKTSIGRGEDVDVRFSEPGVSRLHAEIVVERSRLVLHAKSKTNPTLVNGFPVLDQVEIHDGDEIQLADRIVLAVRLNTADRSRSASNSESRSFSGLSSKMESKIDLDESIESFNVMGTFLDVDVVASRAMKGGSAKPAHIIVSFERFRAYVGGICREWNGQVLNSNGDELMCFFESAASAVLAGSAILERLPNFNRDQNLLERDFRFRLGAHTGLSLVDLDAGVAYSEVLDAAGHIQKMAEPDRLVISQETLDSLPRPIPVMAFGELSGDGRLLYRVEGWIRGSDLEPEP